MAEDRTADAAPTRSATAPADRIPFDRKLAYGAGAFVNNLLAAAIGGMLIVLNLGLGMTPARVGLVAALPRFADALIDPVMGFVSDHTRSRWGRRRPYIFAGALASGLVFALLWQVPRGRSESFWVVSTYPITEQAAREVRTTLEARRGPGKTAAAAG